LDPTTRRVRLTNGKAVLFTDTVGFIQKLPTTLVAAFRATLEEIGEADLLIHVLDVTHPNARQQMEAVQATLDELNTHDAPVVLALNKMDAVDPGSQHQMQVNLGDLFAEGAPISALTGDGLPALLERVGAALYANLVLVKVLIPFSQGQLISLFHEQAIVEHVEHRPEGVELHGRVPQRLAGRFKAYGLKTRRAATKQARPAAAG
jgi:GTP-binding protein HflX